MNNRLICRALNYIDNIRTKDYVEQLKKICTTGTETILYKSAIILNHNNDKDAIQIGNHSHVRGDLRALKGGMISIGEYSYVGENTRIWAKEKIIIGDRVLIAHNCNIMDNRMHPIDPDIRHKDFLKIICDKQIDHNDYEIYYNAKPIMICDDVWIAANVCILRGITIGEGAIVAAGSVVTQDVPARTMVAGNPAEIKRYI